LLGERGTLLVEVDSEIGRYLIHREEIVVIGFVERLCAL